MLCNSQLILTIYLKGSSTLLALTLRATAEAKKKLSEKGT